MHPSTQATVPPVPLPLVPVRWGRLTKPLYQFVHMIILGIQSILIFHHLLNMKEKRSILIFQGFEAAAALKLFLSENWIEPHFVSKTSEEQIAAAGAEFMQSKTNQAAKTDTDIHCSGQRANRICLMSEHIAILYFSVTWKYR